MCACVRVCVHLQETGGKALIHNILTATGGYVHDIMSGSTVNVLKGNFKSERRPRSTLLGTISFTTSVEKEKCPSASVVFVGSAVPSTELAAWLLLAARLMATVH